MKSAELAAECKEAAISAEYNQLVQDKSKASTEWQYQDLAKKFRSLGNYKDTAKLANECENQYRRLKELSETLKRKEDEEIGRIETLKRKEKERRETEEREQERIKQEHDEFKRRVCLFLQLAPCIPHLYVLCGTRIVYDPWTTTGTIAQLWGPLASFSLIVGTISAFCFLLRKSNDGMGMSIIAIMAIIQTVTVCVWYMPEKGVMGGIVLGLICSWIPNAISAAPGCLLASVGFKK